MLRTRHDWILAGWVLTSLFITDVRAQDTDSGNRNEAKAEAFVDTQEANAEPLMAPAELQRRINSLTEELKTSQDEYRSMLRQTEARAVNAESIFGSVNTHVPASEFMPGAVHPNLMGENALAPQQTRFGAGTRIGGSGFIFRTPLAGTALSTYDTGFMGAGQQFDPGTIAYSGSTDHHRAGFFDMTAATANLAFDLQKHFDENGDDFQAQAYLESQLDSSGDLQARHAYGRVDMRSVYLVAGKTWTAWGDEGTLPRSLSVNTTSAGTVFLQTPQLRLATSLNDDWLATIAIQQPQVSAIDPTDPTDPAPPIPASPNAVLQRYPDLAVRLRYLDNEATGYNSFSVGALIRGLGVETNAGDEQIGTGWGVTANGRALLGPCTSAQYGVVGGRGLGSDIFGLQTVQGVASDPTNHLKIQANYGAYTGLSHIISDNLNCNVAYGFARGDGTSAVSFQKAQNAWANLIYRQSDQLSVGFEYHWGQNDTLDKSGGNHRVLLAVQVTPKVKSSDVGVARVSQSAAARRSAFSGAPMAQPTAPALEQVQPASEVSRFRQL